MKNKFYNQSENFFLQAQQQWRQLMMISLYLLLLIVRLICMILKIILNSILLSLIAGFSLATFAYSLFMCLELFIQTTYKYFKSIYTTTLFINWSILSLVILEFLIFSLINMLKEYLKLSSSTFYTQFLMILQTYFSMINISLITYI